MADLLLRILGGSADVLEKVWWAGYQTGFVHAAIVFLVLWALFGPRRTP